MAAIGRMATQAHKTAEFIQKLVFASYLNILVASPANRSGTIAGRVVVHLSLSNKKAEGPRAIQILLLGTSAQVKKP
jgi:hypothetical protein